jgi:hypothetical protein
MALSEVPFRTSLVENAEWLVSRFWSRYVQSIVDVVNLCARQIALVSKTTQEAAITATAIPHGTLAPTVYRVSYTARITRAASTSSSLTVTIGWTDGAVAQTQGGAAMTGNATTTQQNGTMLVHVDKATSITYAAAYASSGGTTMQYSLYVLVEQIA